MDRPGDVLVSGSDLHVEIRQFCKENCTLSLVHPNCKYCRVKPVKRNRKSERESENELIQTSLVSRRYIDLKSYNWYLR